MHIVLLTNDLMVTSRVEGAVRAGGEPVKFAANVDDVAARCNDENAWLVLVDLNTPGLNTGELVERVRSSSGHQPRIVAFGPHVHEAQLAAARDAGCDEVLSRGQFFARVDEIVAAGSKRRAADR